MKTKSISTRERKVEFTQKEFDIVKRMIGQITGDISEEDVANHVKELLTTVPEPDLIKEGDSDSVFDEKITSAIEYLEEVQFLGRFKTFNPKDDFMKG